eukprot:TRINITY_DN1583_c0_g1_i1.p1 TRINITY_DN1583_c0_g1~~TRINITY_DN1583_c0_g1_i1.p1  ORF type:complete len:368 (+),score=62.53 TRINITY_DN1583_c0_g1_i1:19-1122(+)
MIQKKCDEVDEDLPCEEKDGELMYTYRHHGCDMGIFYSSDAQINPDDYADLILDRPWCETIEGMCGSGTDPGLGATDEIPSYVKDIVGQSKSALRASSTMGFDYCDKWQCQTRVNGTWWESPISEYTALTPGLRKKLMAAGPSEIALLNETHSGCTELQGKHYAGKVLASWLKADELIGVVTTSKRTNEDDYRYGEVCSMEKRAKMAQDAGAITFILMNPYQEMLRIGEVSNVLYTGMDDLEIPALFVRQKVGMMLEALGDGYKVDFRCLPEGPFTKFPTSAPTYNRTPPPQSSSGYGGEPLKDDDKSVADFFSWKELQMIIGLPLAFFTPPAILVLLSKYKVQGGSVVKWSGVIGRSSETAKAHRG